MSFSPASMAFLFLSCRVDGEAGASVVKLAELFPLLPHLLSQPCWLYAVLGCLQTAPTKHTRTKHGIRAGLFRLKTLGELNFPVSTLDSPGNSYQYLASFRASTFAYPCNCVFLYMQKSQANGPEEADSWRFGKNQWDVEYGLCAFS